MKGTGSIPNHYKPKMSSTLVLKMKEKKIKLSTGYVAYISKTKKIKKKKRRYKRTQGLC